MIRPLLLLAPILLAPILGPAPADESFVFRPEKYRGRLSDHPRFDETFDRVGPAAARAVQTIEERLGLTLPEGQVVQIFLADINVAKWGRDPARTYRAVNEVLVVALFVENYLSGEIDVESSVLQQMVHATLMATLTDARHAALPTWVREGLAAHVAGQGPTRLARVVANRLDLSTVPRGLTDDKPFDMHAYACLAFAHLEATAGEGGLARLVRRLVEGDAIVAAVESVTGQPWKEFEQGVAALAETRIAATGQGCVEYRAALDRYQEADLAGARQALTAFLEEHPDSAYVGDARFYIGRTYLAEEDHEEAAIWFEKAWLFRPGVSGLRDDALCFLGICYYVTRSYDWSIAYLRDFVDLYPGAPKWPMGQLHLGRALRQAGRRDESIAAYERLIERAPADDPYRGQGAVELQALRGD